MVAFVVWNVSNEVKEKSEYATSNHHADSLAPAREAAATMTIGIDHNPQSMRERV